MENSKNYWFTIEPYVHINIANGCVLLYNTLDGESIESDNNEIIELLKETLKEENCGVTLLKSNHKKRKKIKLFINEIREKYMGDIIDIELSKGKPIQLLPYVNFPSKNKKKYNFNMIEYILDTLSEISIHINDYTDTKKLISFLQPVANDLYFKIKIETKNTINNTELLHFLNEQNSHKEILCSYKKITPLDSNYKNNFSYNISINFPIEKELLNTSINFLSNQSLTVEYIFEVTSISDYQESEHIIENNKIEKYQFNPIYTHDNIIFFEENVYLTKEDILSTHTSIKDLFAKKSINTNDFGKINIMPNGDVYANLKYKQLGNINTHSIYEIIQKEINEGCSWLRIRNQSPCNNCIYQWLCPSPSNYEIAIGRPNLCNIK